MSTENKGWYTPPQEATMSNAKVGAIHELPKEQPKTKEDLPWQAFAIVGDKDDPETWKFPHHTKGINKAIKGKIGIEHSVDWVLLATAVAFLSRAARQAHPVGASEGQIIAGARHLANHYTKAGKSLPDALAVLV